MGGTSETAREREIFRYHHLDDTSIADTPDDSTSNAAKSSSDVTLTAFAQLGVLRLNAMRCVISLVGSKGEYVLAEASRTLSLQDDCTHEAGDHLIHGEGARKTRSQIGTALISLFTAEPEEALSYIVVNDLRKDDRFNHIPLIAEFSFARSLACVPLRSTRGYVIGIYCVLDDKPRDGLSDEELHFLQDTSTTTMTHIENGRGKQRHDRAEKLLKALTLYLEGANSLSEWTPTQLNNYVDDQGRVPNGNAVSKPRIHFKSHARTGKLKPPVDAAKTESHLSASVETKAPDPNSGEIPTRDLEETLLRQDLVKSFSRASNLLREALDVDGVVFYDASIESFEVAASKDEDKALKQLNSAGASRAGSGHTGHSQPKSDKATVDTTARILGYSTRNRSSLRNQADSEYLGPFSGAFLRVLARRYPNGKVFNIELEGSKSETGALEQEGVTPGPNGNKETREYFNANSNSKEILAATIEDAALLKVTPGARSVIWYPLWDVEREKWYSGALIWSLSPARVLYPEDELAHMTAWGNSVMAEVSRLPALVAYRMKVDFVSSISHELLSPLRGILANVDFLQEEEDMPIRQADIISTINSCGKTLLETINHVLGATSYEDIEKGGTKKFPRRHVEKTTLEGEHDLRLLTEEVVDSVYAERMTRITEASDLMVFFHMSVVVIVDIAWRDCWSFTVNAGALRRVLMNMFNNALHHTAVGFVKVAVSLEIEYYTTSTGDEKPNPVMTITVSDSGKDISKLFLRGGLHNNSAQEDARLGLHIVRQVLPDVHGKLDYISGKSGTRVFASIPVRAAGYGRSDDEASTIPQVRTKMRGRLALIDNRDFNISPDMLNAPPGSLPAGSQAMLLLKSSVESLMKNWFEMELLSNPGDKNASADVWLMMASEDAEDKIKQRASRQASEADKSGRRHSVKDASGSRRFSVVIAICGVSYLGRNFTTSQGTQVFYVRLPLTPSKMSKVLYEAYCKVVEEPTEQIEEATNTKRFRLASIFSPQKASRSRAKSAKLDVSKEVTDNKKTDLPKLAPHTFKALLVEGNPENLKTLITSMNRLEQSFEAATNGLETVIAFKKGLGDYDIVFMDIQMLIMDGIEATAEIRKFEIEKGYDPVAIVGLTNATSVSPIAKHEAYSRGMNGYLMKPIGQGVIKEILIALRDKGRHSLSHFE